MPKRFRQGQSRRGSAARRLLEYRVILDQVRRRKAAFVARLSRRLRAEGECLLYEGSLDHGGYARMNFRYGKNRGHVSIGVHRVFAILANCGPIPLGFEAAHGEECTSRRCVRHLTLDHYKSNASTAHKRSKPPEPDSEPATARETTKQAHSRRSTSNDEDHKATRNNRQRRKTRDRSGGGKSDGRKKSRARAAPERAR